PSVVVDGQRAYHGRASSIEIEIAGGAPAHARRWSAAQGGCRRPGMTIWPVVMLPTTAAAVAPATSIEVSPLRTRLVLMIATVVASVTPLLLKPDSTRLSLNRHSPAAESSTAGAVPRALRTFPRTEPRVASGGANPVVPNRYGRPAPRTSTRVVSTRMVVKLPVRDNGFCGSVSMAVNANQALLLACGDGAASRRTRLLLTSNSVTVPRSMIPAGRPRKSPGGATSASSLPLTQGRSTPNVRIAARSADCTASTPSVRIVLPAMVAASARVTPMPTTIAEPTPGPIFRSWLFSIDTEPALA